MHTMAKLSHNGGSCDGRCLQHIAHPCKDTYVGIVTSAYHRECKQMV